MLSGIIEIEWKRVNSLFPQLRATKRLATKRVKKLSCGPGLFPLLFGVARTAWCDEMSVNRDGGGGKAIGSGRRPLRGVIGYATDGYWHPDSPKYWNSPQVLT